jgi:tRNA threonylcarbamoyladenosine biosynthesis protein TsaE
MHLVSQSPADTQAIAAKLAQKLLASMPGKAATVVALRGELGAGKTTFTQGFAKALNIKEQPKSPTFNLMKEYPIPNTPYRLWHLDCYRLQNHKDLASLDMPRIWNDQNAIVFIEWPERIGNGLPRNHIEIHLEHASKEARAITIKE